VSTRHNLWQRGLAFARPLPNNSPNQSTNITFSYCTSPPSRFISFQQPSRCFFHTPHPHSSGQTSASNHQLPYFFTHDPSLFPLLKPCTSSGYANMILPAKYEIPLVRIVKLTTLNRTLAQAPKFETSPLLGFPSLFVCTIRFQNPNPWPPINSSNPVMPSLYNIRSFPLATFVETLSFTCSIFQSGHLFAQLRLWPPWLALAS
jgi:hypothetical protein